MAGGLAAATVGPWLVLVLAACGLTEAARAVPAPPLAVREPGRPGLPSVMLPLAAAVPAAAGLLAVAWEGFKVGALSYGGGFVIIPLMQHDAVHTYHWMTAGQFLSAVALGQVTPGPVVQTVAVVGYAAAGVGGGLLAALVAFAPSFVFVLGRRPVLRPAPGQRGGAGLPDRGRPGRHRRHRRGGDPAGPGPRAPVAARRARARRGLAARRCAAAWSARSWVRRGWACWRSLAGRQWGDNRPRPFQSPSRRATAVSARSPRGADAGRELDPLRAARLALRCAG